MTVAVDIGAVAAIMNVYKPMLSMLTEKPFNDPDWVFEVKWEGIRTIAYIGEELSLQNRDNEEISPLFPELGELTELAPDTVLDGIIVVMNDGKPDVAAVMKRTLEDDPQEVQRLASDDPVSYIVFDILEHNGESLIDLTLMERLEALGTLFKPSPHVIQSTIYDNGGKYYYYAVVEKGLPGVVAKRKDSSYLPGARTPHWLTINHGTWL
jgi:ATP-dependent DNA ligase